MNTTAEKLTYLNDTKGLIKDNINLTGAGLTNQTPFRQYATDLKTALLNILNNGIDSLYNNFPKTTGTGTNISLNNTLQAPIRSVINGDTFQQSYSGKNLLNISSNYQVTGGPIYFDLENPIPAGTYIISITGFETTGTTEGLIHFLDSNNSQMAYAGLNNTTKTKTITVSNPITRLRLYSQKSASASSGITSTFVNLMISINGGDYEPYVGGTASPNPDYPQEIKSVTGLQKVSVSGGTGTTPQEYEINLGKNLFDIESTDISSSGSSKEVDDNDLILTATTQGTSYIGFNIRNIKPNTEYTLSYNANAEYYAGYQIRSYNEDNVNTVIKGLTSATDLSFTFTTPSDTSYLRIYLYASNNSGVTIGQKTTYSNIQLEEGSQSSYSPYFTPIKLNKIGTYQDYITGTPDNWSIKRQIGGKILNGTESYSDVSVRTNTIRCLYSLQGVNYTAKMTDLSFNNGIYNQDKVGQLLENNYLVLSYPISVVGNTINSLKTWLSNNNSLIIYRLLEETTEPITNTELIEDLNNFYNAKSYNGQTNISVEGDLPMILDVSAIKGDE